MEEINTEDGSVTCYNKDFGDVYHSKSGAKEEAFEKFAKPALIPFMTVPPVEIKILDVCFGLGYNSCAAIDFVTRHMPDTKLTITGLENDSDILEKTREMEPGFEHYDKIRAATEKEYNAQLLNINIIKGDALETIKGLEEFDIVFHDPFSPKKHPELWSEEFFKEIFKKLKPGGVLLTYSCAKWVRENLKEAGFTVEDGPSVGRKAPSTMAIKPSHTSV